ncbi:MAG TPA: hypothetical protein VM324_02855, partial [Egibacteraceae bacterium]|nr:hypothetical protein [Egibacteraceae bacterium]
TGSKVAPTGSTVGAPLADPSAGPSPPPAAGGARARIAVAGGSAFSFAYPENRELLAAAGAELVDVDPTIDEALPPGTDGLYLGGGFPETHADALAANAPLRAAVAAHAAAGRPVHAECGGLLYLCRTLDGRPMCGVVPADATIAGRRTLGYRAATAANGSFLWPAGAVVRGHEFHYSAVTPPAGPGPAWRHDDGRREGHVTGNVHASYLHTHWAATPAVAARFVAAAARSREAVRA